MIKTVPAVLASKFQVMKSVARYAPVLFVICLLPGLFAQSDLFEKAPPPIDKALRERVTFFYQSFVDGKFRQADQVVHEDSKDAFFAAGKRRYQHFDIVRIKYSEKFTRAVVMVAVKTQFMMPPAGLVPAIMTKVSKWKWENDQWWWYVEPAGPGQEVETPFGAMKPGGNGNTGLSPLEQLQHMPSASELTSRVKVSSTRVSLNCAASGSAAIKVTNNMPGSVRLGFRPPVIAHFSAVMDKSVLNRNEEATLRFSCQPDPRLDGRIVRTTLTVDPINKRFPLLIKLSNSTAK